MSEQVCAVVVTHNRRELLRECLQALTTQTRSVDTILVVNNVSTDGTQEMLNQDFPEVRVINSAKNIGGAGGFHEGIKWGYEKSFDWLWVMDDDTIAAPNALEELFIARSKFDVERQPRLLASKITWTDESLHPMNLPKAKSSSVSSLIYSAEHSTLSLRSTSFVSLLIHRSLVEQYGLPIAGYFIWNDDAEYTARILRNEFGVLVPKSIAVHKTVKRYASFSDAGPRYYFEARNKLWMLTRSNAWSAEEKLKLSLLFLKTTWSYLVQSKFSWVSIRSVTSGIVDGIFKTPKLEP